MIDQPSDVRPGEELNTTALEGYLRAQFPDLTGAFAVAQFPSGFSNLTYFVQLGEREMVLRRPPFGAVPKSGHDMQREFRVLTGLARVHAKAPRPLLYCADDTIIGAPFYVMERVHGVILRAQPRGQGIFTAPTMRNLSGAVVDTLAAIHNINIQQAGLSDLGHPQGYIARQVSGWTKRYRAAQTEERPQLDALMQWLASHQPGETAATLIHNDYKLDNLVLDPADLTRVLAVLDWEMCTVGDPLLDLGTTLGYWIEPSDPPALAALLGLTTRPGAYTREEVVARYAATAQRAVPDPLFYYVFGVFKIAVIVQQIYSRFVQGHTQDPRFGQLNHVVSACEQIARSALDTDRISRLNEAA